MPEVSKQRKDSARKLKVLPLFHVSNLIIFLQFAHIGFGGGGKGYSVTGISSGGDYLLW